MGNPPKRNVVQYSYSKNIVLLGFCCVNQRYGILAKDNSLLLMMKSFILSA